MNLNYENISIRAIPGLITQALEHESPLQYIADGEKQMKFIEIICHYEHISIKDLYSNSRINKYVITRQLAIWLFDKIFKGCTLSETGKVFNRDHSTILYSKRKINEYLDWDKNIVEKIKFYKHLFKITN